MKFFEEIDVKQKLAIEDFNTLFEQLPLNEEEKNSLGEYYKMYELFLQSDIDTERAWITVRNIFAIKNQQIADRMKREASLNS